MSISRNDVFKKTDEKGATNEGNYYIIQIKLINFRMFYRVFNKVHGLSTSGFESLPVRFKRSQSFKMQELLPGVAFSKTLKS